MQCLEEAEQQAEASVDVPPPPLQIVTSARDLAKEGMRGGGGGEPPFLRQTIFDVVRKTTNIH